MKMMHLLLTAALTGLCAQASAQWQWIDKDGHKVFSDRAPPTEIPDKNILKRPGNRVPLVPASGATEGSDAPVTPTQAVPIPVKPAGGLDKELEAKKKQAQEAEAAKRKAAEEEMTKAKVESCARAKQAKATYESGIRVGRTNAAGEQEFLDEAARAEELKRIQGIIAKDCR